MRTSMFRSVACFVLFAGFTWLPAAAQGTASLSGRVTDVNGAPLVNAAVDMRGPSSYATRTDAGGNFSISGITPGLYTVAISKAGYTTTTDTIALVSGQSQPVNVSLALASFSNLVTIAHVSTGATGAHFNVSPASVSVVPAQVFSNQAQTQVIHVLDEIPGLQISYPGTSANGAAPGAITVPTIRDAASYETAALIDGHPLAVQDYGDYVTTFLSAYMFSNVEVIKGPGATAPEVNNAINGTVNFHTKDPTLTPTPDYQFGYTNFGGTFANFGFSDTVGNLGFVVDVAEIDDPSPLNGKQVWIDPGTGSGYTGPSYSSYNLCDNYCEFFGGETTVHNTESGIQTGYSLVGCCYTLQGDFENTSELVKLRYHLSSASAITVSYLGGQSYSDQSGNIGNITLGTFTPGSGYTGSLPAGSPIAVDFLYPGAPDREVDNEPIFQAEFSSAIGNDTIVARYYHATLDRFAYQGTSPTTFDSNTLTLYGTSYATPTTNYNGVSMPVYFADFFNEVELDKLAGWSFEYDHPFATADDITVAVDQTNTQALDYEATASYQTVTLPQGSWNLYTTVLLRGTFLLTPEVQMTVADYQNIYKNNFPDSCPFAFGFQVCAINGDNTSFGTQTTAHNDPRMAFEFRPNSNLAIRAAAGSAIAPPYLALLSQISPGVATTQTGNYATIVHNAPNLRAETAFGYDIGADFRFGGAPTVISADAYLNDLYNHYFDQTVFSGTFCGAPTPCTTPGGPSTPVYYVTNTNVSSFRFEGVELAINSHPLVGLGYTLAGGVEKGYVYNLPKNFYCSAPTAACINNPANWDQNLNIIAGQNLNGEGIGSVVFSPFYGFNSSISGLNTREPYSQGYGELSYAFAAGSGLVSFGETYFGNNNSFNVRPFTIANATVRVPIAPTLAFQVSGENVFNALSGLIPIYGGGVPIQLANSFICPNAKIGSGCGSAATVANVWGPAQWSFILTKRLP